MSTDEASGPNPVVSHFLESFKGAEELWRDPTYAEEVDEAAGLIVDRLRDGAHVFACGNGGSAADAQHFAAELVVRYRRSRGPIAATSLSTDTSVLTACANDFCFDEVFERQLKALGRPGDVLVAISTSGASENVVRAVLTADDMGIFSISLTGRNGGRLALFSDVPLRVPSDDTPVIQQLHECVLHAICARVEADLAEDRPEALPDDEG